MLDIPPQTKAKLYGVRRTGMAVFTTPESEWQSVQRTHTYLPKMKIFRQTLL